MNRHDGSRLNETRLFQNITALLSANVNDSDAKILSGKLYALLPRLQSAETVLSKKFAEISDNDWNQMLSHGSFETIAFRLNE